MRSRGDPKSAWLSLGVNLAYGLYAGTLGALERSWWFLALAAYYIVLAVMRFASLRSIEKADLETERFITRFIGGMCLFLAVTLAGTTYLSFSGGYATGHHEIVMITMALYITRPHLCLGAYCAGESEQRYQTRAVLRDGGCKGHCCR